MGSPVTSTLLTSKGYMRIRVHIPISVKTVLDLSDMTVKIGQTVARKLDCIDFNDQPMPTPPDSEWSVTISPPFAMAAVVNGNLEVTAIAQGDCDVDFDAS